MISEKSRLSNEDLELADQAYTWLALLCKDEASAYVRSAEDGNGSQAWQAPLRARTARNATNFLKEFEEPTFASPDGHINLRQWSKNAENHATATCERVTEGIREAVYMNKIAPQDMRQHLMLNQARSHAAEDVAEEIEDYWDATEDFSRDGKGQAGFIAPVWERLWETREGWKTRWKRVKAKGSCTTDSDPNPSVVSRDVLEETATGVGDLATKKRSGG